MGQQGLPNSCWVQAQAREVEMWWMGVQERSWGRRDESRDGHAGLPTHCACDRAKRGLPWVWGRVGVFDPEFGFGLEADSGSESESGLEPEPGQIRMGGMTLGILEHLESLAGRGQSSRAVLTNRKQARRRWRRWRRLRKNYMLLIS